LEVQQLVEDGLVDVVRERAHRDHTVDLLDRVAVVLDSSRPQRQQRERDVRFCTTTATLDAEQKDSTTNGALPLDLPSSPMEAEAAAAAASAAAASVGEPGPPAPSPPALCGLLTVTRRVTRSQTPLSRRFFVNTSRRFTAPLQ
jgi:hypothetical protein